MEIPRKPPQNIPFKDIELECQDCGCKFVWEAGEQSFFASKGLAKVKRYPKCRTYRRQTLHPPASLEEYIQRANALFPNDHQGVGDG
jgi:hypothetical protein